MLRTQLLKCKLNDILKLKLNFTLVYHAFITHF